MKRLVSMFVVAALAIVTTACSTVGVTVPVNHPAEINLKGKNEIIIGDITGNGGPQIADMVREKLAMAEHLKIIDRQNMDKVMAELQLGASDLASPEGQAKLGKIMTGSILVSGRMDAYGVSDDVTKRKTTCTKYDGNGNSIQYPCIEYTRNVASNVRTSFTVTDVASAQNLRTKLLSCKEAYQTKAYDKDPDPIDTDAVLVKCAEKVAFDFIKVISPWTENVVVYFKVDKDLPSLETGVNYAKAGSWEEAVSNFKAAIDQASGNPEIKAKTAARAHWNLGLAMEYTGNYEEAIKQIKKAYELSNNDDFLAEIENVKKMKAEQEKLQQQLKDAGVTSSSAQ